MKHALFQREVWVGGGIPQLFSLRNLESTREVKGVTIGKTALSHLGKFIVTPLELENIL